VAAPRGNELGSKLFAQIGHVNIQQIRHRAVVFIEQVLVQSGAREELDGLLRFIF
jgi:hypothetical protein